MTRCSECRRRALFLTRKLRRLRARRDHDLRLRCFRKLVARVAAEEERNAQAQALAGAVRALERAT